MRPLFAGEIIDFSVVSDEDEDQSVSEVTNLVEEEEEEQEQTVAKAPLRLRIQEETKQADDADKGMTLEEKIERDLGRLELEESAVGSSKK